MSDIAQEKWKKIVQEIPTSLKGFYGVVQLTNHCKQQINNQVGRQHIIWDRIEVTLHFFLSPPFSLNAIFSLSFLKGMNGQRI